MSTGWLIFGLIVIFVLGGLLAFLKDAQRPLPKNLPPALTDEDDEDDAEK